MTGEVREKPFSMNQERRPGESPREYWTRVIRQDLEGGTPPEEVVEKYGTILGDKEEREGRDGMIGLYNRNAFDSRITEEIAEAQRFGGPLSLLFIDIDEFKPYNDTYGHSEGDKVLRQFGKVLLSSLWRTSDLSFRYGGEEFTVLLLGTSKEDAKMVAERIRTNMEKELQEVARQKVTVSVGIACLPQIPRDLEKNKAVGQLINRADVAMYEAKARGRNQTICWEEGMPEQVEKRGEN